MYERHANKFVCSRTHERRPPCATPPGWAARSGVWFRCAMPLMCALLACECRLARLPSLATPRIMWRLLALALCHRMDGRLSTALLTEAVLPRGAWCGCC